MHRTNLLIVLATVAVVGCEKEAVPPAQEEASVQPEKPVRADAGTEVAAEVAPCVPRSHTNLSGAHIQFPVGTRCSYTLAELREGIVIPYHVVVTEPHRVVSHPQDAGRCQAAQESGLAPFAVISDGLDDLWCVCDEGMCGYHDPEVDMKLGTYSRAVEWGGRNWTGPSDTDLPKGEPFEPGTYKVTVSAVGTLPAENGRSFRVEAELPIDVTAEEGEPRVVTELAPTVRPPIDRWGAASAVAIGGSDRYLLAPDLGLTAVADGSPGASMGDVVAQHTIDVLRSQFVQGKRSLKGAVERANTEAYAEGSPDLRQQGMGASVAAAATTPNPRKIEIAHVGTSRVYRWREGKLELLTRDHLLADELVNTGEMSPQDLANFPYKGVASRAVGARKSVAVDVEMVDVEPGDVIVTTTKGLHRALEDPEIARILGSNDDLQAAAQKLITAAKHAGGNDNMTVVLFRVRI